MSWSIAFPKPHSGMRIIGPIRLRVLAHAATHGVVIAVGLADVSVALAQTPVAAPRVEDPNAPANLEAGQMSGRPDREIVMERDVEITRGATVLQADRATYNVVDDEVEASGNIRMKRFGDRYTGENLRMKMDSGQGYISKPTYFLELNRAQGNAARIDFESQDQATVTEGTYSTCEGPDPDWYLKADTLDLDVNRDVGTARKTVVYFKGVPILGAPAMTFPLSSARKSGWLPPTIGTSSTGGFEVVTPYYFNIAPNRDLTLYPKLITKRGLQLGADARYMGETYRGETRLEGLANDRQTGTTRYAYASTHFQSITPALSFSWDINGASDDDYPSDFSRTITNSAQRLLLRNLGMNYVGSFWSAGVRASKYQVLQDLAAPIARPYDRVPQFTFAAARQDVKGFDMSLDAEATRFYHPDLQRGERAVVNPRISYPIITPGYFFTPKISFHATRYRLTGENTGIANPLGGPGSTIGSTNGNGNLTRSLPTFSLDSGLIFERETRLFNNAMTQTLEPRLFYVHTPYRDQSRFPNFDTAEADLSFAQLFAENRFVGNDRISDANQITAAITSRYIENSGAERLRVSFGQRFYLSAPRVTINPVVDPSRSDLLASISAKLTQALAVDANLQYSESTGQVIRANYGTRWQPAPKKVLNLLYRRDAPNKLEQAEFSTQWPLAQRWYGVARVNYSLPDRKVAEGLAGLEYKADCWVARVVAQRTPTATNERSSSLFFQLELNGLTRLGSNPIDALRTGIPGYQIINQPDSL
ncbi:MAG: LPS-assembly protein LptD [Pseudomonadota bacterium]